ncbi:MAG: hypothetical protein RLZZ15_1958, partial [Verrucomicrobiota bacterium]
MKKKSPLLRLAAVLGSLALALAFAQPLSAAAAATPQKPNVLFIAIDDLRDWV